MWHCKYSVILDSNVTFDETYMKMSKYKNSVFPYSLHSTFLHCMEAERRKCYFNVFSPSIHWDKWWNPWGCHYPILWRNLQNWNLPFRNFLLKYELRIKDKEVHDKDQKINKNLFSFKVLKELSPKIFS